MLLYDPVHMTSFNSTKTCKCHQWHNDGQLAETAPIILKS